MMIIIIMIKMITTIITIIMIIRMPLRAINKAFIIAPR